MILHNGPREIFIVCGIAFYDSMTELVYICEEKENGVSVAKRDLNELDGWMEMN